MSTAACAPSRLLLAIRLGQPLLELADFLCDQDIGTGRRLGLQAGVGVDKTTRPLEAAVHDGARAPGETAGGTNRPQPELEESDGECDARHAVERADDGSARSSGRGGRVGARPRREDAADRRPHQDVPKRHGRAGERQLKQHGLGRFHVHGFARCSTVLTLGCIAHNLTKWKAREAARALSAVA